MPPVVAGLALIGGAAVAAGGVAAAFAATGVIAVAAQTGVALVLSGAAQALAGTPQIPDQPVQDMVRSTNVTVRQTVAPWRVIYGRRRVGGTIVYASVTGGQQILNLVVVFAAHRVHKIGAIYFDGELAFREDGTGAGRWREFISVEKRLGTDSQTAFSGLVGATSEWTSAHRLRGHACIYLRMEYDPDAFPTGLPNITADIWGRDDIFDPRTGATGYTENSALCVANYMADPIRGLGVQYGSEIDTDALIESANICDEEVPRIIYEDEGEDINRWWRDRGWWLRNGGRLEWQDRQQIYKNFGMAPETVPKLSDLDPATAITAVPSSVKPFRRPPSFDLSALGISTVGNLLGFLNPPAEVTEENEVEPRYSCSGVILLDQDPKIIIEQMLSSMAGHCVYRTGRWFIRAGAYREPELTLGPDDFRAGGLQVATRVSMAENFNGVRGQFVSSATNWQPDDYPPYASEVYRAEDGGERKWLDLPLPFTTSPSMAQRIAKIELERARRQISVRFAGKLRALAAGSGDTVALTYPRDGFDAKPFVVRENTLGLSDNRLVVDLSLRETSPLVYDWEATEEQIYAAAPQTTLPSAFDVAPPGVPTVTEQIYVTRDGSGVKVLARVAWTAADGAEVAQYRVRARPVTTPESEFVELPATTLLAQEFRDIEPGDWEFQVRSVSRLGVSSPWRSRLVTILGLTAEPLELEGLSIQTAGGVAILKWEPSRDLDVRIGGRVVIRHSKSDTATWANSVSLDEVQGNMGVAAVPLKPGTYLVRARDSSGNYGPVSSASTKGAQAVAFTSLDFLQADPAFSGAKTNVEVDSGSLKLTDIAAPGLYEFASGLDFGTVKSFRLRSEIDVAALSLSETIDDREDNIDDWADFDGTDGAETDVIVEARFTDDDPSGTPEWTGWQRVDSTEIEARALQARARLLSLSDDFNVLVSEMRVYADEVT